jgi:hypothetical protein
MISLKAPSGFLGLTLLLKVVGDFSYEADKEIVRSY